MMMTCIRDSIVSTSAFCRARCVDVALQFVLFAARSNLGADPCVCCGMQAAAFSLVFASSAILPSGDNQHIDSHQHRGASRLDGLMSRKQVSIRTSAAAEGTARQQACSLAVSVAHVRQSCSGETVRHMSS